MPRSNLARQRLLVLFFLGLLLLFSPLALLFDRPFAPFGIPLLYIYLFGTWVMLIGLTTWILRSDAE
mgnify:CR=1 FL=1